MGRDFVFENAPPLLQHALTCRDFHAAIRAGGSGRVDKCVAIFAVLFQSTELKNYVP